MNCFGHIALSEALSQRGLVATPTTTPAAPPTTPATAFSAAGRKGRKSLQFRWDNLLCTVQDLNELSGISSIPGCRQQFYKTISVSVDLCSVLLKQVHQNLLVGNKERHRETFLSCTPGTPNAVDIVLHIVGEVKIDDDLDIVNIKTTSGDIGRCLHVSHKH